MSMMFIARLFPQGDSFKLLGFSRKFNLKYRNLWDNRLLPFAAPPPPPAEDGTPAAANPEPSATEKEKMLFFTLDLNQNVKKSLLLIEFAQKKEVVFGVSSSPELHNILREAIANAEKKAEAQAIDAHGNNVPAEVQDPLGNIGDIEMNDVSGTAVSAEGQTNPVEPAGVKEEEDEEAQQAAREYWDSLGGPLKEPIIKWYNVNNNRPIKRPDLMDMMVSPAKKPKLSKNKASCTRK